MFSLTSQQPSRKPFRVNLLDAFISQCHRQLTASMITSLPPVSENWTAICLCPEVSNNQFVTLVVYVLQGRVKASFSLERYPVSVFESSYQ